MKPTTTTEERVTCDHAVQIEQGGRWFDCYLAISHNRGKMHVANVRRAKNRILIVRWNRRAPKRWYFWKE